MENEPYDPSTQNLAIGRDEGPSNTISGPGRPRRSGSDPDGRESLRHSSGDEGLSDPSTEEPFELDDMVSESGLSDDEETGLTSKERHERRWRNKRRTQLDARIADDIKITKEEGKLADVTVVRRLLVNTLLIGSW